MRKKSQTIKQLLCFMLVFVFAGQTLLATTPKKEAPDTQTIQANNKKLSSKTIAVGRVQKSKQGFQVRGMDVPSYHVMDIAYVLLADLRKVGANITWDSVTGKTVIYDLSLPVSQSPIFDLLKDHTMAYLGRDLVYINNQEVPAIYVGSQALIPAKWIPSLLEGDKSFPSKELGQVPVKEAEKTKEIAAAEEVALEEKIEEKTENRIEKIEDGDTTKTPEDRLWVLAEEETKETDGRQETQETQDMKPAVEIEADLEEQVPEEVIKEPTEEVIRENTMKGINIWFNGKDYIEHTYNYGALAPGEFPYYQDHRYNDKAHVKYVGFVITELNGVKNTNAELHKAWLKNATYYTIPKEIPADTISALFPDTRVKGIMRQASGGFAKGETVDVNQASSNRAYHLVGPGGKIISVPWNSVAIQSSPVTKEEASKEQIEQYINSKDFSSKTDYFVWTDIYRQRTYVFKGAKNNWTLIRNMLSSTGKDTHLTPVGRYTLNVRVPSFGSKQYRAKNAYGFIGTTYLYHSVLYDPTGSYLLNGWGKLGNKASSGCIRLSPEDSEWLYKTMPIGTGIYIN